MFFFEYNRSLPLGLYCSLSRCPIGPANGQTDRETVATERVSQRKLETKEAGLE